MDSDSILSDDEPVSMPSMPTQWGGDPAALGRVDHYDILHKLGGGGFGVVYLARDTASGVEVAIKTLHPLLKHNAEEMDLLREKFRLVSRLTHTNIAKALVLHPCRDINIRDEAARAELKLSPGDSVMVMDYAPGVTLSRWRRQFPDGIVPFDLALEVGRQVASALDYAHSERIVHRDVKPGNIMVETLAAPPQATGREAGTGANGGASRPGDPPRLGGDASPRQRIRVRLLDFGLAAEIRSSMSRVSTEQGDTSGTRPYMAPEQWLGRKQDGRTDQYALACVLYELLSGAPPFAGVFETGDPMIMMATVKGETPEGIENLDPATNTAFLRALAKVPKDRFPSCAAFVAGLSTSEHTEGIGTEEYGKHGKGGASSPSEPLAQRCAGSEAVETQDPAALEADVLLRKFDLSNSLKNLSAEDRRDGDLASHIQSAEKFYATAEEALKFGRFVAAARCLDRTASELETISQTKGERQHRKKEEAERCSREEEERKRRSREIFLELEAKDRSLRNRIETERKSLEEMARRERMRPASPANRSQPFAVTSNDDYVLQILLETQIVSQSMIDAVASDAANSYATIVYSLVRSNKLKEDDVLGALAKKLGMQFYDISELEMNDSLRALLPGEVARRFGVVPLYEQNGILTVAMADPLNFETLDNLRSLLGKNVEGAIAPFKQIDAALGALYPETKNLSEPNSVHPANESTRKLLIRVIVGVVLLFFGAYGYSSFSKNRHDARRRACISNMRQIETACENYLCEHDYSAAARKAITGDNWKTAIIGPQNYIKYPPVCPEGGTYRVSFDDSDHIVVTCGGRTAAMNHVLPSGY